MRNGLGRRSGRSWYAPGVWIGLLWLGLAHPASGQNESPLVTVAEASKFQATSRHADVMAYCKALAAQSDRVQLITVGQTRENRPIPMLILSPKAAKPEPPVKRADTAVVLAFANIHAGEVDGKEAVLMWARDWIRGKWGPARDRVVVLLVPILNGDGNERIDVKNRREQGGPIQGVGIRENADGYDLNRDFVKLETPEIRALVQTIHRWDPDIIIDLHTTNGSYHRFPITYDIPRNPNAQADLIEAVRNQWMPRISATMKTVTGFPIFYYGNFNRDRSAWETVPPVPRFGIQYFAMRNRVGILSESYSYDPFEKRVKASYGFLHSIVTYAADHPTEVRSRVTAAAQPRPRVALRAKQIPLAGEHRILGYREEIVDGRPKPTQEEKEYPVVCVQGAESALTVTRPFAYLLPEPSAKVVENLRNHGITLETLTQKGQYEVGAFRVGSIQKARNPFQKHTLIQLDGTLETRSRDFPVGTLVVKTDQPLGNLASYLLEPMAEDGLFTWNFFDAALTEGQPAPVYRLEAAIPLTSQPLATPQP